MKIPFIQNVGWPDRMLRICVGVGLIVIGGLIVKGTIGIILMILSIPLFVSGIIGFCPAYIPLGISTKRKSCC